MFDIPRKFKSNVLYQEKFKFHIKKRRLSTSYRLNDKNAEITKPIMRIRVCTRAPSLVVVISLLINL